MKFENIERNYLAELFHRSKAGMLNQKRVNRVDGQCVMIDDLTGNRCALGFMLSDETTMPKYLSLLNKHGSFNEVLMIQHDIPQGHCFSDDFKEFCCDMMSIHDNIDPEFWESCLNNLQKQYGIPDLIPAQPI